MPSCDCHLHGRQVCDICQGVTGHEKDRLETPPSREVGRLIERVMEALDETTGCQRLDVGGSDFRCYWRGEEPCNECRRLRERFEGILRDVSVSESTIARIAGNLMSGFVALDEQHCAKAVQRAVAQARAIAAEVKRTSII